MHRLLIGIIITGMLACNDQASDTAGERKNGFTPELKTKEDSLYHDVMQGHDVGMAKIGKVRKYLDQSQRALDSINKLPAAKIDTSYRRVLTNLHEDLKYADYGMNAWMEEFMVDSGTGNNDLRIQYLQSEKEKVNKVKEHILVSLQRADSLFKNGQ
jgi:hypothetical protein